MDNCKGFTQLKKQCNESLIEDTNYCKTHQYMNGYTDEMLNNLTKCTGCKNYKYLPNGGYCEPCKDRKKLSNLKRKEKAPKCKSCDNKPKEGSEYCGNCILIVLREEWRESVEQKDKKVCYNYDHNSCRTELDKNYKYSKCPKCLEEDRNRDHARSKSSIN